MKIPDLTRRIDQLGIPSQWRLEHGESHEATFSNEAGDDLALNYFAKPPDIQADIGNVAELRACYRKVAEAHDIALVEADSVLLDGVRAVRTIFKARLDPRGFAFLGSFTLPFADSSLVIKVQSLEQGITGMRETTVFSMCADQFEFDDATEKMIGWEQDPYDPDYKSGFLPNHADQAQYDEQFPEHPLSKVRRYLREIASEFRRDASLKSARPFVFKAPR